MKLLYGLLGILTFMPALSPLPARAETPPQILFSEINWAGSEASTADEWLELANTSDIAVDLTDWSIMNGAGTDNPLPLPPNSIIPAHGTFLIANYPLGDLKTTLNVKAELVTTAISLANSTLNLSLVNPDGVVVDSFVTGSKPAYGSTSPYSSSVRNLETLEWSTAIESVNLTQLTQLGTPGFIQLPAPTLPTEQIEELLIEPTVELTPESEPVFTIEPMMEIVTAVETVIAVQAEPVAEESVVLELEPVVVVVVEPEPVAIVEPTPTPTLTTISSAPPAPVEETPTSPVEAPTTYPIHSVVINEFISDPADGTEWIEIVNTTDDAIDLTGWTEKDGSTSKTLFPAQLLEPLAYFVLQNPKGKLNNDGDSIFLFDATGKTIDAISYDKTSAPKKGKSLARTAEGVWKSSNPTPLTMNNWVDALVDPNLETYETANDTQATLTHPESDSGALEGTDHTPGTASVVRLEREPQVETPIESPVEHVKPTIKSSKPSVAAPVIDSSEINNYPANMTVTIEGVLVAGPGTFGKQLAYVDGLEVYFNKADWPKLQTMTRVRVTGTVDVKTDYTRLKIKKRADIKIIGDDSIAPDALETLDDARHGLLMSLSGSVVDVVGKQIALDLENGDSITATSAKDASVDFSDLAYGDRVAVTGITRLVKGAWTFTILEQSGLTKLQAGVEVATDSPVAPSLKEGEAHYSPTAIKAPARPVPWVGGGLLTTSIGALGYWFAKAKGITLPSFS